MSQEPSRGLLAVLGSLAAYGPMSIDMYLPGLPSLTAEFATGAAEVQLTLSTFLLGFAVAHLAHGPLSDRFGRRPVLVGGIVIYVVASLGCALASDITALTMLRFVQAVGGAVGPVLSRAIVRDLFERTEAARMLALMMLAMGAAPLLAPSVGGLILIWLGWRAIFVALALFGLITLLLVIFALPETLPAERRTHHDARRMAGDYLTLVKSPRYLGYALSGVLVFAGMFAYISGSPFVFIQVFGVPPEYYGLIFGLNVIGLMSGGYLGSRLVRRLGVDRLLAFATYWAAGIGPVMVAVAAWGDLGIVGVMLPLLLYMCSVSVAGANATAGGLSEFPRIAGTASALIGTLQYAIGAFSGYMVGLLFDGTPVPMAAVIAVVAAAGLACRLILVRGPGGTG